MTWDYDKKEYEKQAKADPVWALERQINYGRGKKKINRKLLAKYIKDLKIPESRRAFLELLLWNKKF